jgi:amino-acid N-acetyltransferase
MGTIRKAKMKDVDRIVQLVNQYAEEQLLLPRSKISICESLMAFSVLEENGRVQAVAALHISWEDLAEIRSLAVDESAKGRGFGRMLVERLIEEARELGIRKVIALTYEDVFFEKCGFSIVQKEVLPHKVWKDCLNCSKFPVCDEIAMMKELEV